MRRMPLLALPLLLSACEVAPGPAGPDAPAAPTTVAGLAPTTIAQIQGRGPRSPHEGITATIEGVVVGNFSGGLEGVFIQSLAPDADPETAEGLWLPRRRDAEPALHVGDHVRVTGTVRELGDGEATLTSLTDASVEILGKREIAPTVVQAAPADWETLEGMFLHLDAPLTVTGNDGLGRYGELLVAFGGRVVTPTEVENPSPSSTLAVENARRLLRLDDNKSRQNPDSIWYLPAPLADAAPLRAGSVVRGAQGVLDQRFGSWRLQLTEKLAIAEQAVRPPAPTVPGDRRIAGFNVLNLFNGDGKGGGFPTERGAETREQYERQQAKLIAVVQALDPDLAALMELENDGYGPESSLAQFVAALNAAGPHRDWRFVDAGAGPGNNPIRVGLIYRSERFTAVGAPATIVDGPFAEHSRAPLAQAFRAGADGPVFVVAANHFKSKGGCHEAVGGDADTGDGQGCHNSTRVASARALHEWLGTDPTGSHPVGTLVIGDLNAYAEEDPLRLLRSYGWADAFATTGERPYSFVYMGQAGRLDHALLDAGLAARLRGAAHWHNNSAEADLFDYRRERGDDGKPNTGPWRASDHDPVLLGFDLTK
jgi:predicted extracellular nuclease